MAGQDSRSAIIIVVIMMMTVIVIGTGWYILSGDDDKKKGTTCTGPDVNAVYQYDDDENCVWVSGGGGGGGSNQANKEGDGGGASGSNQGNNGEPPPCEYNQENPYITGSCFNTDGVELIGGIDSCGDGQRSITVNGIGSCPEPYNEFCTVKCPCILDEQEPLLKGACERNGVELTGGIDSCGVGLQLLTPNGTGDCPEPYNEICTVPCPCVLDEDEPYTYGQCLDKVTSVPLTGEKNSCGPGQKSKDPNVKTASSGGGFCPQSTFVDCDKACVKLCEAPDEYWRPVEGASCMSGTKKLGERTDLGDGTMGTFHGIGTQMKYLDGTGLTDSEKDVMNFDACIAQGPTLKSCRVMQTADSRAVPCPIPNYDAGWSYQGGGQGTVYTKFSAEALFNGELERGVLDLVPMTPVSRDDAINLYQAFSTSTGEVIDLNLPKGYKIAFKASNELDPEYLRENGCSIFKFEEASAPRTREDATWVEVAEEPGDCYDVDCSRAKQRDIEHNIVLPAWGGGSSANKPTLSHRNCDTATLTCCVKGNDYHYTVGACDSTGKKTFTKTDACSIFNDSNGVANYQEDCCYVGDWDGGECNVGDKLGYKKYTRNVPNAGICTGQQLGEHEVGDPNVKYTRDADACDTDCVIGALTITDSDASGNQFMINSGTRRSYARKVSYAGSTPAEGLGSNWCSEWQNLVRECPSCPNTINIAENDILMTSSNGLLPVGNTHRTKIMDALGLSSGGTNYFSCGGSGRWNSNQTGYNSNANCGAGNAPPPYWE